MAQANLSENSIEAGVYPLLPLRSGLVLPGSFVTLPVGRPRSRRLAQELKVDDHLVLGLQRDPATADPVRSDLFDIGVVVRVKQRTDRGARGLLLMVEGLARVSLGDFAGVDPFLRVQVEPAQERNAHTERAELLAESLRNELAGDLDKRDASFRAILSTQTPGRLADRLAVWVDVPSDAHAEVLNELDVEERLGKVTALIAKAKAASELRDEIDTEVRKELGKNQREAVLREHLKAIKKQLGDDEDGDESAKLRSKLEAANIPHEEWKSVERELKRLEAMPPNSPDAHIARKYLEFVAELPWDKRAETSEDLGAVEAVLEADHEGLEEPKKRILEHMAVLKLNGSARGTILCLVGPPGVGKTSLAQSVARATNRPLARIALGGVRDEAEVRGHRRTYVGALPGRVLSALRTAEVKNPVVVLDEVDKLGRGWQGDPEAALLEVLDPEQNANFTDHYLELPFDLSEVLFIATANDLSTMSGPLRDRLEVIDISGYTTQEKATIAARHLLPRELEKHGLPEDSLVLGEGVLQRVIRDYTREAGVRQLRRELAKICRHFALDFARRDAQEPHPEKMQVEVEDLRALLGRPRFFDEVAERIRPPGVAAGLAWTPVGGDVLYVETTRMKGGGKVEITGQLGDVMSESVRAALAYIRTHAEELGIDPDFLKGSDLHVHVPAGAVKKDGPSAGVTMFTALTSLLTGRKVRPDTAMTGEATLRGRVLPVGGIKSKLLAAHRAGFGRVLVPKANETDLAEIPEGVLSELEVIPVADMREVFALALEDGRHEKADDAELGGNMTSPPPTEDSSSISSPL